MPSKVYAFALLAFALYGAAVSSVPFSVDAVSVCLALAGVGFSAFGFMRAVDSENPRLRSHF